MFDTFDILIPALAKSASLNLRPDTDRSVFKSANVLTVNNAIIARVVRADEAYTDVPYWTGAPGRESWLVLLVGSFANNASTDDVRWQRFLDNLETVLGLHETWLVTCESDCEAADLEQIVASPSELTRILDRYRTDKEFMSLRASSLPE